jgi:hypothetical protein
MSRVTIKTGFMDADGREEELIEYLCDYPNCPNIATTAFACRALGLAATVCEAHAYEVPPSESRLSGFFLEAGTPPPCT